MKILVVDDSPTSLNAVCNQVRRLGMTPLAAGDGASGLALWQEHAPDLALLDVVMPGMDGLAVARALRGLEKTPGQWRPIVFLTVRGGEEDLARGIAAGGDDYLMKPVSEVVLAAKLTAMKRLIDMRQALVEAGAKLDAANRELRRLSAQDGLTGIANRRHFDDVYAREWRRAARGRTELSLIVCDIDYFKQYNDLYGHQAGDECLRAVAACLMRQVHRGGDWVSRYGGEEFAVVLPATQPGGAAHIAEKMRAAVEALGIAHAGSQAGRVVTISAGLAGAVPAADGAGQADLLQWADAALYDAKRQGRNRVVNYQLA